MPEAAIIKMPRDKLFQKVDEKYNKTEMETTNKYKERRKKFAPRPGIEPGSSAFSGLTGGDTDHYTNEDLFKVLNFNCLLG